MTILKNVPRILPPRLIYAMAQMGHGDELVLADANFPAHRISKDCPGGLINCDGSDIPTLLSAILTMLPLDETAPPCVLMSLMEEHRDAGYKTPIWMSYKMIADRAHGRQVYFEELERFAFYERAKKAYAVVATGETALYGNLILKKGTIGTSGKDT